MANLKSLAEQKAHELRQLIINKNLTAIEDESEMMMYANLYPTWEADKQYSTGDILSYGLNEWQETQLYKVQQSHKSQTNWTPNDTPALYKTIGITEDGFNFWTQPTGAHDTYTKDDIVKYNDKLWKSTVDNNAYAPGVVAGQWVEVK